MQRVVLTGIGIVSVLGQTQEAVTASLFDGRCGIVADPIRLSHGFVSPLTGAIDGFDPSRFLGRKERKTMPDFALWAHAACMDALSCARLEVADLANDRTGLVFGNDSCVLPSIEQAKVLQEEGATSSMGSGHVFRCMNSTISLNLSVLFGIKGPCWTVSAACASGAFAIAQAADQIRLGRLERVLCGGAQELNWQSVASFDGLGVFSTNPDPKQASRPFDRDRDGLVPSGGAAALVLEDYAIAKARKATILAEILGIGMSCDGVSLSTPDTSGLSRALRMALRDAQKEAREITLISAHATSTQKGDAAEAANIRAVFGEECPPVTALKSLTGHELWMSGASQLVYGVCMAQGGFVAKTENYQEPDAQTQGIPVVTNRLPHPPGTVLHNASGFGGTNCCLIVRYF